MNDTIISEYNSGLSATKIAKNHNIDVRKVLKILRENNVALRDKSQTQKAVLSAGGKHPTKGQKRDDETRLKISLKQGQNWESLSEDEKEKRRQNSKEQMEKMSHVAKREMQEKAIVAIRKTSKEGSRLEKFLTNELRGLGYHVELHKEHFMANEKLKLDLYLPKENIVIEVDGPSHFENVWGDKQLRRQKRADVEKNGFLISRGINIIRIKHKGDVSLYTETKSLGLITDSLSRLKGQSGQIVYLEV